MNQIDRSKVLGGALIVAGTAIGAGMLALPIVTGAGGLIPALFVYLICWLFSVATGLLFLEICLWMPQDANIITMSHQLLGRVGKVCAWILYIFLFYCLTIAYVSTGGEFVSMVFEKIPKWLGVILFTEFFGTFVYTSTRAVDRVNFILMLAHIPPYLLFIIFGVSKIQFSYLSHMNWISSFLALPVIFTSFSYQGVIPSLNAYLNRNPKMMRLAILIGTSIPFVIYIIWEILILGIVPIEGPHGLLQAKAAGNNAIEPLKYFFPNSPIYMMGQIFGFFAITTSFLGVTLGLLDFLSDGLQVEKKGLKKVGLCLLIYVPPTIIAIANPGIFLKALGYAGGIGCAILLGLFPALMVWVGRYRRQFPKLDQQLPGGKLLLLCLMGFVGFELLIEFIEELL